MTKNFLKGIALICFCATFLVGCSNGANTPKDKPLSTEEGVIQTNSSKIGRELSKDSLETIKQTYESKKIKIIGQVEKKWLMNDGSMCICIGQQTDFISNNKYYAIRLLFKINERDLVNSIKIGDFVVAKGTCSIYEPEEEDNKGKSIFLDLYNVTIE